MTEFDQQLELQLDVAERAEQAWTEAADYCERMWPTDEQWASRSFDADALVSGVTGNYLEFLSKYGCHPGMWSMVSDMLFFAGTKYTEQRRRILKTVAATMPRWSEPLTELGYLAYVHDDDALKSLSYFEEAIDVACAQLREALIGKMEALTELERREEHHDLYERFRIAFPDGDRLHATVAEQLELLEAWAQLPVADIDTSVTIEDVEATGPMDSD